MVPTRDGPGSHGQRALNARGAGGRPGPLAVLAAPPLLMVGASLLFAVMGVCIKFASGLYGIGEIVMYRSAFGLAVMGLALRRHGVAIATPVPLLHLRRSGAGVTAILLWFHAITGLPLATAATLNYTSSVWIAVLVIGPGLLRGRAGTTTEWPLPAAVAAGFVGMVLVLQPTFSADQWLHGLTGLGSGLLGAFALLGVAALGRAGEPELRVVFYFSAIGVVFGAVLTLAVAGGFAPHTTGGIGWLLAIGALASAAQWMLTTAFTRGAALGNAALQYSGILFSYVLGLVLFGDALTWAAGLGIVLIVGAGIVATRFRAAQPAAPPHERASP